MASVWLLAVYATGAIPATAQELPEAVERAIFESEAYTSPVNLKLPALADSAQLAAFRQAVVRSRGLSPIAPPGHINRDDERVRLACSLKLITLESVRTREGHTFDYAIASPELEDLAPDLQGGQWAAYLGVNGVPAATRKLQSIDYRNRYRANPMGMGERDVISITFSYTLDPSISGLAPPSEVFKGKATVQQDPEDGEWKLEKIELSDRGDREFYESLPSGSTGCVASGSAMRSPHSTQGEPPDSATGKRATGFIVSGNNVPVFKDAESSTVETHLAAGTPAANAKGTRLGAPRAFALEEENGRTHIVYLQERRMKTGWIDSAALTHFSYDCSCKLACNPMDLSLRTGSSWNECFQRSLQSQGGVIQDESP